LYIWLKFQCSSKFHSAIVVFMGPLDLSNANNIPSFFKVNLSHFPQRAQVGGHVDLIILSMTQKGWNEVNLGEGWHDIVRKGRMSSVHPSTPKFLRFRLVSEVVLWLMKSLSQNRVRLSCQGRNFVSDNRALTYRKGSLSFGQTFPAFRVLEKGGRSVSGSRLIQMKRKDLCYRRIHRNTFLVWFAKPY
jgi:hypothetical protein